MADYYNIAKEVVQFYNDNFDTARADLKALYREESIFTFEGWSLLGTEAIIEKLVSLPFKKVQHQVSVLEAQPSKDDCIIISVTGILLVDEEQRPIDYTQTFLLDRDSTGSWFVRNDIVRFVQCLS